jgi:hypothetical protein
MGKIASQAIEPPGSGRNGLQRRGGRSSYQNNRIFPAAPRVVDFYLSDQLVSPGGLMAFDDMWMPSVRTVISFILTNRQYKIVPQSVQNMMVLKKIADDNRDRLHFEKFIVHEDESDSKLKEWF